jgi:hypothetical protein
MAANTDDVALDCRKQSALMEAEKAAEYMRKHQTAEAEKKELLDRLAKPSGVSDEERMKRAAAIIKRSVVNGLTEVDADMSTGPSRAALDTICRRKHRTLLPKRSSTSPKLKWCALGIDQGDAVRLWPEQTFPLRY